MVSRLGGGWGGWLAVGAAMVVERRDDGIDDLRVEARIKKNLALGFRLGNLDLRSIGGAGCLSEGARSEHGDRVTGGETFENRTTSNSTCHPPGRAPQASMCVCLF